jgi:hypothetical protein
MTGFSRTARRYESLEVQSTASSCLASGEEAESWLVGRYHEVMRQAAGTYPSASTTELRGDLPAAILTSLPPKKAKYKVPVLNVMKTYGGVAI